MATLMDLISTPNNPAGDQTMQTSTPTTVGSFSVSTLFDFFPAVGSQWKKIPAFLQWGLVGLAVYWLYCELFHKKQRVGYVRRYRSFARRSYGGYRRRFSGYARRFSGYARRSYGGFRRRFYPRRYSSARSF